MDFRQIFFDPQGRISPRTFGQAYVLLTGALLMITVVSIVVSPGFGILQYVLVFPFVCVFSKRLHDAALSAWLMLLFLLGALIINVISSAILMPVLAPEAYAIQMEAQTLITTDGMNAGLEHLLDHAQEIVRSSALVNVVSLLVSCAITGFTAFVLRSDPKPNRFGPPTTGSRSS
ncbi:DUF805 domain-containing protein [Hyphomonas sp. NPDC076900]|uniref:DUF805 domain-containing protein n=1 Tax=unclassified Hyphomonas TaxID=2630699 RepID=UPI003D0566F9